MSPSYKPASAGFLSKGASKNWEKCRSWLLTDDVKRENPAMRIAKEICNGFCCTVVFTGMGYRTKVMSPFNVMIVWFSQTRSSVYTYTSGGSGLPLNVPSHPCDGSLALKFAFEYTICPQRVNILNPRIVFIPLPLG